MYKKWHTPWEQGAWKKVNRIVSMKPLMAGMTDEGLREKADELRKRRSEGEPLGNLLVESYALVREAALRTTGMEPYPVQLLSAVALHEGKIAEQKTGEGKTLAAVLPAFLNALDGKGVHVVTVNDYLASRDAAQMGKIYSFLGLTVGAVLSDSSPVTRKKAYACDITYVTNRELGFDYLRDNMAASQDMTVQRGLYYAIIDEVDSILIDEARTPLIIAGTGSDVSKLYVACNAAVKRLSKGSVSKEFNRMEALTGDAPEEDGDFVIHEKEKNVTLTAAGVEKIEKMFGLSCYADPQNAGLQHAVNQCLRANFLMKRDKDYIVKDGKIQIVDTFTGRVMEGHQFSDGLHQAIEAKERVGIREENRTVAMTTYQSFFNKYGKICGMTGTAYTQRKEFASTYGLKTVVIPTNMPMIRNDRPDVIYTTKKGKYGGVIGEIKKSMEKGQPVLVGTASIHTSEELHYLLSMADIPHRVLNAKQDAHEAEIIAQAGRHGAVTVATNMAGRGTDIMLDDEARAAGGLKVIGTELHEAARIDDQLRGRSGRQGDPGESVFYISAEDEMVRLFTGNRFKKILNTGGFADDVPVEGPAFDRYVRKAQKKVENNHFGMRKNVLDYDMADDRQRELIYAQRRKILSGGDVSGEFLFCLDRFVEQLISVHTVNGKLDAAEAVEAYNTLLSTSFSWGGAEPGSGAGRKRLAGMMKEDIHKLYEGIASLDQGKSREMERFAILKAIDASWMEQLRALEYLRQDIWYQGFAQVDPKSAYTVRAFGLYSAMKDNVYRMAVLAYFSWAKMGTTDRENGKESIYSTERRPAATPTDGPVGTTA